MKFACTVSLAALALAGCATSAVAPPAQAAAEPAPAPVVATADALPYPATPEGARQFVAGVEKDLAEFYVISSHAQWLNATYINEDSDAVNAYFGTIGTEKGVKYATEAAQFAKVPGLDPDTA